MNFFFLACTPRTGNFWFRKLLAGAIRGTEISAHQPHEINWSGLQAPCIVAMHWHRTPDLTELLQRRNFEVIVTVRHPLYVLRSILHFCHYQPATAKWLEGQGGDESPLFGADPTSPQFLQYALSPRAKSLLGISAEWQPLSRAVIKYEELVADTEGTLQRTLPILSCEAIEPLSEVVQRHTLDRLRMVSQPYFWRGEPGLWRRLIPPDYRRQIYDCHKKLFELWDYGCPEGPALPVDDARENWRRICEPDVWPPASGSSS